MPHEVTSQDVDYAVEQAIMLYHHGNKPGAVRTFARLLRIGDSPEARSATNDLIGVAENWDVNTFESQLRQFVGRFQ